MSASLALSSTDRLLILAPHPDDESIATGGLVQITRAAGAAVRVVVLTDGDNNPWPQRWIEKRWRIDSAARARWGARRREEGRSAICVLGLDASDATFLGLPDLGLTDLLMRDDRGVVESLRAAIVDFKPSLLVLPALSDRHPDHSSAHVLARLALVQAASPAPGRSPSATGRSPSAPAAMDGREGPSEAMDGRERPPRMLAFAVHGGAPEQGDICVALSSAQREIKQAAILAHETQMRLGRRRFLRYAGSSECFRSGADLRHEDSEHPLRARMDANGRLCVRIDLRCWRGSLHGHALFVALDDGQRWLVALNPRGGSVNAYDCVAGRATRTVNLQRDGSEMSAVLECAASCTGYVKLALPRPGLRVFDRFGWQVIRPS